MEDIGARPHQNRRDVSFLSDTVRENEAVGMKMACVVTWAAVGGRGEAGMMPKIAAIYVCKMSVKYRAHLAAQRKSRAA